MLFNKEKILQTQKGKLIVLEGIDGSGKSEQFKLLKQRLLAEANVFAVSFDFPRYGTLANPNPASYFVRKYLKKPEFGFTKGYGKATDVNPYVASLFYALDRFDAAYCQEQKPNLVDYLEKGIFVISNRYTQSNIGHQARKLPTTEERTAFIKWLLDLEYRILKIPEPDLVLLFNIPVDEAAKLKNKQRTVQALTLDAHEEDLEGLRRSQLAYLEAAALFKDSWSVIDLYDQTKKRLLTIEEVHEIAWQEVTRRFNII